MTQASNAGSVRRFLPRTLQARLSVLVLATLLVGLWVFGWAVNIYQERRLQELLAAQQLSAAGYVAEDIDNKIKLRLDGLAMIADRFPVDHLASLERTRAFLAERRAIYNLFDGGLIVVKPDVSGAFADYPPVAGRLANRYGFAPFTEVIETGRRSGRRAWGARSIARWSCSPCRSATGKAKWRRSSPA